MHISLSVRLSLFSFFSFVVSRAGLDFWRHEPLVLVYACLAVDSFAKRAEIEAARSRTRSPRESHNLVRSMTRKILTSQEDESGKLKMTGLLHPVMEMSSKPVSWMPQDGSDVVLVWWN